MHVAVSLEPLEHGRTGLGHFSLLALRELRRARPQWHFSVMAVSSMSELEALADERLRVIFWDKQPLLVATVKLLELAFQSDARLRRDLAWRLWGLAPLEGLRRAGGRLPELYRHLAPIDVVWAPFHTWGDTRLSLHHNLAGLSASRVLTVHDLHPLAFPQEWGDSMVDYFRDSIGPFAHACQAVVTHSQYQRRAAIEKLALPDEKVSMVAIPPLIDSGALLKAYSQEQILATLEKHGIRRAFAFSPASQTRTHKNHVRLLLAWKLLHDRLGDDCPLLVGTQTEPYWAMLTGLIEALGLREHVLFTGSVDTETLAQLYQASAMVIIATLYEGGGSGPVAEALLVGKPVLAADIEPIREQMAAYGTSDAVTWFDPYDHEAIANAVEKRDPEQDNERALACQKAILSAEPRLWRAWAEHYAAVFEQAATQRLNASQTRSMS